MNPPVPRISLDACRHLVFDEADKLLDLGFAPQIDELLSFCPKVPDDAGRVKTTGGLGFLDQCDLRLSLVGFDYYSDFTKGGETDLHKSKKLGRYGENCKLTMLAGGRWQTDADNDVLSSSGKVQQSSRPVIAATATGRSNCIQMRGYLHITPCYRCTLYSQKNRGS